MNTAFTRKLTQTTLGIGLLSTLTTSFLSLRAAGSVLIGVALACINALLLGYVGKQLFLDASSPMRAGKIFAVTLTIVKPLFVMGLAYLLISRHIADVMPLLLGMFSIVLAGFLVSNKPTPAEPSP